MISGRRSLQAPFHAEPPPPLHSAFSCWLVVHASAMHLCGGASCQAVAKVGHALQLRFQAATGFSRACSDNIPHVTKARAAACFHCLNWMTAVAKYDISLSRLRVCCWGAGLGNQHLFSGLGFADVHLHSRLGLYQPASPSWIWESPTDVSG